MVNLPYSCQQLLHSATLFASMEAMVRSQNGRCYNRCVCFKYRTMSKGLIPGNGQAVCWTGPWFGQRPSASVEDYDTGAMRTCSSDDQSEHAYGVAGLCIEFAAPAFTYVIAAYVGKRGLYVFILSTYVIHAIIAAVPLLLKACTVGSSSCAYALFMRGLVGPV